MPIVLFALPLLGGFLFGWVFRGAKDKNPKDQPPTTPTPPPNMMFR